MNFNLENIKKTFKGDNPITIFNIKYTKEELECINNFNINSQNNFKYVGDTIKKSDLKKFFKNIGDNQNTSIDVMINIILKLINKILKGSNKNNYLIIIRSSVLDNNFTIPRWHIDGNYFSSDTRELKFVTSLIGPGTLFINNPEAKKIYDKIFKKICNECKNKPAPIAYKIQEKYRSAIHNKLRKFKYIQLDNTQGCIFEVGSDSAIIHSEPDIITPRLFISILPYN